MPNTLDLNLMVIARQAGMDLVDLPDLYIADPPRKAARGRESDRLVLYMAVTGQPAEPSERPSQVLPNLASVFYKSPGSATSALRQVVENFNQTLYQRNISSAEGSQRFTRLICFVLRGDQATLAQCGPVKSLVITAQQSQEFYDPDLSSLGMREMPEVRYFQTTLQPNDSLLIAAQPAENWTLENLRISHGQGPESVRRRLLGQTSHDLSAILIQARPGKGNIYQLRSAPVQAPAAMEDELSQEPPPTSEQAWPIEALPVAASEGFTPWIEMPGAAVVVTAEAAAAAPIAQDIPAAAIPVEAFLGAGAEEQQLPPVGEAAPKTMAKRSAAGCLLAPLLWLSGLLSSMVRGLARLLQTLLSRVLPEDTLASISNTGMAAIALIIPVVVVAVSSFVYFQRGVAVESQMVYEQAVKAAQVAREQTDPLAQRQSWEKTLEILNQAGTPQSIPEAAALRSETKAALDVLNQIKRVDYQPAIVGGLPATVHITSIISNGDDLYLLDGNSNTVLRASYTAQGYVLDLEYQCSPNTPSQVGPFVDILPGSGNTQPPANTLSLDPAGNLLYCTTDAMPNPQTLQPPVARTFSALKAFAQDFSNIYVLDPPANAVWVYPRSNLSQEPRLYFDDYIPPMQDTIDLATAADELYLLHSDGHLTLCQSSNLDVSPTRCTEPASYLDSRPGLEEQQLVPANPYSQIQYSEPPDPALYLLEPSSQAIDLFSLQRLTYQRRFLPANSLAGGAASAFAVDPLNRILFLAAGYNVYYGRMP